MPLTPPLRWPKWLPAHLQTRFVLPTLVHSRHLCCALCAGVCVCVFGHFGRVRLCVTHGPQPARLLCPWDSPGKNTGVGYHTFLQGIFPVQGSNPCLPNCRRVLYLLSHLGSPLCEELSLKSMWHWYEEYTPQSHLR